ncbi:hypothetical protein STEG23_018552, partial [Scotinomys teguina]
KKLVLLSLFLWEERRPSDFMATLYPGTYALHPCDRHPQPLPGLKGAVDMKTGDFPSKGSGKPCRDIQPPIIGVAGPQPINHSNKALVYVYREIHSISSVTRKNPD